MHTFWERGFLLAIAFDWSVVVAQCWVYGGWLPSFKQSFSDEDFLSLLGLSQLLNGIAPDPQAQDTEFGFAMRGRFSVRSAYARLQDKGM